MDSPIAASTSGAPAASRLDQVDGLRAVAALMVVAFHYTTQFDNLFIHHPPIGAGLSAGFLGVNLFFAVSGFVIFMTLDRISGPLDFVVSRFTRLFPTYWAAVAITWATVTAMELTGYTVSWKAALFNLTMLQGFFGIPHVDLVYWTLQIELLFYAWMLAAWAAGLLARPWLLCAWPALALVVAIADQAGWPVPHTPRVLLIVDSIPWFTLGMAAYLSLRQRRFGPAPAALLAISLIAIAARGHAGQALAGVATAAAIFAATRQRLGFLAWRPFVFFGAISYPLYLVHEKIGWLIIAGFEARWGRPWAAIATAFAISTLLAYLLHSLVETRASQALRERYRAWRARTRDPAPFRRPVWAIGVVALLGSLGLAYRITAAEHQESIRPRPLALAAVPADSRPCAPPAGAKVVIALGETDAASHAEPIPGGRPISLLLDGHCVSTGDPLPHTTGHGASVWTAVHAFEPGAPAPAVLAPLAVDGLRIRAWVRPGELNQRLRAVAAEARSSGLPIAAVLWQHGQADAQHGTAARLYRDDLVALRDLLDEAGVKAPLVVAKSTFCEGHVNAAIRRAVDAAAERRPGILIGPDMDRLGPEYRRDGCHFNNAGRLAAAALWEGWLAKALGRN